MDQLVREPAQPQSWPALPPESPLAMPVQSLRALPSGRRLLPSAPGIAVYRGVIGAATLAMTAVAANEMYRALGAGALSPLGCLVLGLYVLLFAWIALAFASALGGFLHALAGGALPLALDPSSPLPKPTGRAALLMPVYNESAAGVMAALQAMWESLGRLGAQDHFDIFILSDTTNPDLWIAEEAAFLALRRRTGAKDRIFYRRRPQNLQRKAGNIAEWVGRFGAAYPHMLILDADSIMTGDALVRLLDTMERHPRLGLLQTLPIIVNAGTLFARLQQFAGRVYGPLIAHGIALWHGDEGNYWGHNAMIRTQAFAEQAGLPELPGRKPFGGHVLSHDFVEAALMRRAGWGIRMVPQLRGSYEEVPPSLIELSVRDRRWCQGNLQHAAILPARGLHWISRLHMMMGIGSYVTAPMWLLFLLLGVLMSLQARFVTPDYFPVGRALFPTWPVVDPVRSMWVFVATMGVLLAPKLFGCVLLLANRADRRASGGTLRVIAGLLLETLVAGLLAPVTMLVQSADVVAILLGRDAGWQPQRRADGAIPLRTAIRRYATHSAFGILLALAAYVVSPSLAAWMAPVALGLALAVPLAMFTAASGPGQALRRLGLLRTPEEASAPPELARALVLRRLPDGEAPRDGIRRLLADPALLRAHLAMLPPDRRPGRDPLDPALLVGMARLEEAASLSTGLDALTTPEKLAVLGSRAGLRRLVGLARPDHPPVSAGESQMVGEPSGASRL